MTTDAATAPRPSCPSRLRVVTTTPSERIAEILENPGFGKIFTDHMVVATWTADGGWDDAQVRPYGPSRSTRPPRSCTTRRRSSRG